MIYNSFKPPSIWVSLTMFSYLLHQLFVYLLQSSCCASRLRWDWEVKVPELNTSVFIIPAYTTDDNDLQLVKNKEDRLVRSHQTAPKSLFLLGRMAAAHSPNVGQRRTTTRCCRINVG